MSHTKRLFYFNLPPDNLTGFAGSFGPKVGRAGMLEGGGGGGRVGPFKGGGILGGKAGAFTGLEARTMANFAGDGCVMVGFGFGGLEALTMANFAGDA